MAVVNRETDPRLVPIDIALAPLTDDTGVVVENAAAQVHTVIVEGVYGPEEVEEDTGSVRR